MLLWTKEIQIYLLETREHSTEVHVRGNIEVSEVPTTTVVTTTISTPTSPNIVDIDLRGTDSPQISLPERTVPRPTVTATCRPRTWMQQLTEGQTAEPRREGDSSKSLETMEEMNTRGDT